MLNKLVYTLTVYATGILTQATVRQHILKLRKAY